MKNRLDKLDELKALEKKKSDIELVLKQLDKIHTKLNVKITVDKNIMYHEDEIVIKFEPQDIAIVKYLNLELDQVIADINGTVKDLYQ